MNASEYAEAIETLRAASRAYYDSDGSGLLMSDAEYDALMAAARVFEEGAGLEPSAVTGTVAAGALAGGDVQHSTPMLSLDNVFSGAEFTAWAARVGKLAGEQPLTVDPKMDGLAVAILFRGGRPAQMVTRGDGQTGEDVSYALTSVANLPQAGVFTGEVRGEVIFSVEQFQEANRLRVENGDKPFVNARNGAAGALRGAKDRPYRIGFDFIAYDVASGVQAGTFSEAMAALERVGFTTARSVLAQAGLAVDRAMSAGEAAEVIEQVAGLRDSLPYEIDGAVIKIDSYQARERAGAGSKAPRWAIAYKYPAQEATSVLRTIHWQVGRTGVITPRAEIDPTFVAGATITFATLHNPADIERKGFMLGDTVLVKRAGEVIPRLEAPLVALRNGTQTPIVPPQECPRCGGTIDRSQERWRCVRGRQCGLTEALSYAVSRDALDIEGLGKVQVANLVAAGTFTDVASIFEHGIYEANLTDCGVAPANATKIVTQIEQAKRAPLARLITALGIRGTGRSASRALARHFGTLTALQAATVEELADVVVSVNRLGTAKAELIVEELADLADVIDRLAKAGVEVGTATVEQPAVAITPGGSAAGTGSETDPASMRPAPLAGKSVVVTGTMKSRSRNEMNELVESLGGRAASSVSKNTDLLVAGPGGGSKLTKAQQLGITVMSEDEFLAMNGMR